MCIDKAHEHPGNLYNGNRVFMASKSFYEGAKGIGELVEDCGVDEAVEKALGKLKGLVAEEGASLWTKFAERVGLDSLWGALSDVGAALGRGDGVDKGEPALREVSQRRVFRLQTCRNGVGLRRLGRHG